MIQSTVHLPKDEASAYRSRRILGALGKYDKKKIKSSQYNNIKQHNTTQYLRAAFHGGGNVLQQGIQWHTGRRRGGWHWQRGKQ